MRTALLLPLALLACDRATPTPPTPGAQLERAALAAGIVADPPHASLTGSWARDSDRVCVLPAGTTTRIGALVDYGEGQGCAAAGEVERAGERLRIRFGDCRFDARFDGDRIAFPAELPSSCDRLCTGRATLAALEVERLGGSASEAATLRTPGGRLPCGG